MPDPANINSVIMQMSRLLATMASLDDEEPEKLKEAKSKVLKLEVGILRKNLKQLSPHERKQVKGDDYNELVDRVQRYLPEMEKSTGTQLHAGYVALEYFRDAINLLDEATKFVAEEESPHKKVQGKDEAGGA